MSEADSRKEASMAGPVLELRKLSGEWYLGRQVEFFKLCSKRGLASDSVKFIQLRHPQLYQRSGILIDVRAV